MPLAPIPIASRLVPMAGSAAPAGFTIVDEPLISGLPQPFPLLGDLVLVLAIPTGLAATWRDSDPAALLSRGTGELEPVLAPTSAAVEEVGSTGRTPARLFLRQGGSTLAAVPLVVGSVRALPGNGDPVPSVLVRLVVLDWELRAGSMRGPGNFGSRIRFAWRAADRGTDQFAQPPPHPRIQIRSLPGEEDG